MNGTPILFLNGTSSSGKTTLAKAFQAAWPDTVLYASVDSFRGMLPEHVLQDTEKRKAAFRPVIDAFTQSLPMIAAGGFPVIVDYVVGRKTYMEKLVRALAGHRVYVIDIKCSRTELERRERLRGDRVIGAASWQLENAYWSGIRDCEIDTEILSPEAGAEVLKTLLLSNAPPAAFTRLSELFAAGS